MALQSKNKAMGALSGSPMASHSTALRVEARVSPPKAKKEEAVAKITHHSLDG